MVQKLISCGTNTHGLAAQKNLETEDNIHEQILYSLHNPSLSKYWCQIPEGTRIRGYSHGWFILSNNIMWSVWNPTTSKYILLPPLILKDGDYVSIRECCLSSPPDDPSSVLLLTSTEKPTFVFCRLSHRKKKLIRWSEISYAKQLKRITNDGCLLYNLTCCKGKVYALNTDGSYATFVIRVDIVVTNKDVVINLFLFGACPAPPFNRCSSGCRRFLKGSDTELFSIILGFEDKERKTLGYVSLLKLDLTSIKWEELEGLKDWDMTGMRHEDLEGDVRELEMTRDMWEEVLELKDAIFCVDLARNYSVFYSPTIASQLGGYIHIRSEIGKVIYSYCLKDKNITLSSIPSPLLPISECTINSSQEEEKDGEIVARSITDDEVESNESHLLNLPYGILETIMEYCVGVEYMKFRATCTRCHLAAPLIRWREETTLNRLQTYALDSPWLMLVDGTKGIITFTDPMFGDKYHMKNIPVALFDGSIYCSRYGWLLIYTDCGLDFYNPFTRDIHELPDHDTLFGSLCFSAPPTSPECMVVGFARRDVYIHSVSKEPSWRRLNLNISRPYYFRFQTFLGRDLYALCNKGKLHVFKNIGREDYSWEEDVAEAPKSCCTSRANHFLMKCDQHLILVIVGEFGEFIEVFRLNDSTKEWEQIDSIGKHMIYICGTTCLCIEAKTSHMENKIFFPRLQCMNKKMVFYSLETRKYHTFNGKIVEGNYADFIGTIDQHFHPHAWIEPSWS